jgi:hypothetical protein
VEVVKEKIKLKLTEKEKEALQIVSGMGDYIYDNNYCHHKSCSDCPLEKICGKDNIIKELEDFLNDE